MRLDIRILQSAVVEGIEVVDADDAVAFGQKAVEGVRTDKSGTAGEKDFHSETKFGFLG